MALVQTLRGRWVQRKPKKAKDKRQTTDEEQRKVDEDYNREMREAIREKVEENIKRIELKKAEKAQRAALKTKKAKEQTKAKEALKRAKKSGRLAVVKWKAMAPKPKEPKIKVIPNPVPIFIDPNYIIDLPSKKRGTSPIPLGRLLASTDTEGDLTKYKTEEELADAIADVLDDATAYVGSLGDQRSADDHHLKEMLSIEKHRMAKTVIQDHSLPLTTQSAQEIKEGMKAEKELKRAEKALAKAEKGIVKEEKALISLEQKDVQKLKKKEMGLRRVASVEAVEIVKVKKRLENKRKKANQQAKEILAMMEHPEGQPLSMDETKLLKTRLAKVKLKAPQWTPQMQEAALMGIKKGWHPIILTAYMDKMHRLQPRKYRELTPNAVRMGMRRVRKKYPKWSRRYNNPRSSSSKFAEYNVRAARILRSEIQKVVKKKKKKRRK